MPQLLERITLDPAVCHGKPCIRGMRYPVETILELLSSGMTTDEILADYRDLEREDLHAAIAYGARLAHLKRLTLTIEKFVVGSATTSSNPSGVGAVVPGSTP